MEEKPEIDEGTVEAGQRAGKSSDGTLTGVRREHGPLGLV